MVPESFKGNISELPVIPVVAHEINVACQRDDYTPKSLGAIISKDPVMVGKLLRLANSSYYGLVRQVTTIDRAITLLGVNTVRNLALTLSVSALFRGQADSVFNMEGLWRHSLATAVCAKEIVRCLSLPLEEEAFLSGIIHDIGSTVLVALFPAEMREALALARQEGISQSEAEQRVLGFNHQDAGAFLAEQWNFPSRYQGVIQRHHDPVTIRTGNLGADQVLIASVYTGNLLAKHMQMGTSLDLRSQELTPSLWDLLGVSAENQEGLETRVKEAFSVLLQTFSQE